MDRHWPPRQRNLPVVFFKGNETTGLLKSISVELSDYYKSQFSESSNFFKTDHCFTFDVSYYLGNYVVQFTIEAVERCLYHAQRS